jgi:hypothetical protein
MEFINLGGGLLEAVYKEALEIEFKIITFH